MAHDVCAGELEEAPGGRAERTPGHGRSPRLVSFVLGQIISVLITGTGAFSSLLAAGGVDIPVSQSSLNYILLCLHLPWVARTLRREGPAAPAWRYAVWALCDVEANYFVVWAYQYTSIASVMLLDCFAIPCAMVLSRIILGAQYGRWHLAACLICVAGLSLTVVSDVVSGKVGTSPKGPAWFGDVLVIVGAALYGLSNVLQESLLKGCGRRCEALGMLGLWGTLFSCLQAVVLERSALMECNWSTENMLWLLGFQLCLFGMYVFTSNFLMRADAALFNLSLLTSDLYSVIFSWRVQHGTVTWMYSAAFITTLSGLVLYHTQPPVAPGTGALGGQTSDDLRQLTAGG
uniref:Solute carrier family 35 member F2 n=1 Tax=Alexandrium catenella TaxID=2925 RepID=A0A7S1RHJ1_ALECA